MNFRIFKSPNVNGAGKTGGRFWETDKYEPFVVGYNRNNVPVGRISGTFYGLHYNEEWYLLGSGSDSSSSTSLPSGTVSDDDDQGVKQNRFLLIAYTGQTLRGRYQGAFILTNNPHRNLGHNLEQQVRRLALQAKYNFDDFTPVAQDARYCAANQP